MNIKSIFSVLVLCVIANSCNSASKYIYEGKGFGTDAMSMMNLKVQGLRIQENPIKFDVCIGHYKGFTEDWETNKFGNNPGYGSFCIRKEIQDESGNVVWRNLEYLKDFPNDEKYAVKYQDMEGVIDAVSITFSYQEEQTYDLSKVNLSEGFCFIELDYYDDKTDESLSDKVFVVNFVTYRDDKIWFTKREDGKIALKTEYEHQKELEDERK